MKTPLNSASDFSFIRHVVFGHDDYTTEDIAEDVDRF